MPVLKLLEKFFKKKAERDYLKLRPILEEVQELREPMQALDDEALRGKSDEFRQRLAAGETVDDTAEQAQYALEIAEKAMQMALG